jgi:hypothetical protein
MFNKKNPSLQHEKHDCYRTPKSAWEAIQQFIPKDKKIWECFYCDGESGSYLTDLGFDVIHEDIDFFSNNLGEVLISNPPFSLSKEVMNRLKEIDKPFIMIMPLLKINTSYIRNNFKETDFQIIIPRKRIHFEKMIDGKVVENWKKQTNFDCLYYCYKMNLPNDIIWLEI